MSYHHLLGRGLVPLVPALKIWLEPRSPDLAQRFRERNLRVASLALGLGSLLMLPGFLWFAGRSSPLLPLLLSLMSLQSLSALALIGLLKAQHLSTAGLLLVWVILLGASSFLLMGQSTFGQITLAMYMLAIMVGHVVLEEAHRKYVLLTCLSLFALILLMTNLFNFSPVLPLNLSDRLRVASTAWLSHLILLTSTHFVLRQLGRELQVKLSVEQAAREQAEAHNRLKSEFLANVTHELKTPLNGVLGSAVQLQMGIIEDEDRDSALQEIIDTGRQVLSLIDDLLHFGTYSSGKFQLAEVAIEPSSFLRTRVEKLRPLAVGKGLSLDFQAETLPENLYADPLRLGQIVDNLLTNAIKFTPQGTVILSATATATTWTVAVRDTGIGIPETALSRIFESFQQADGSTTREFGGTGLGLAIVKSLVEKMQGEIKVTSTLGVGTWMSVTLPYRNGANDG